jgi:glycosyltransferase involved in cell wall biosynthesis
MNATPNPACPAQASAMGGAERPFRPVLLVPHYNHVNQFEPFLPALMASGTPILVVDDGSDAEQRARLGELAAEHGFELLMRPENRGKGDAMLAGFKRAAELGYSHALQVDADGQHDPGDIPRFLDCAEARPDTLVCGAPLFGEDAPWVRVWGRKLTDLLVFLETWTTGIRDGLCGFRVYPLEDIRRVVDRHRPGARMDVDAELLVAARWYGMPLHFLDTHVSYPENGQSHFRYGWDNLRMVALHLRLLPLTLIHLPRLVADRLAGRAGAVTGD